ncbi:unnamed protein product [Closterium sp. NIES-54]
MNDVTCMRRTHERDAALLLERALQLPRQPLILCQLCRPRHLLVPTRSPTPFPSAAPSSFRSCTGTPLCCAPPCTLMRCTPLHRTAAALLPRSPACRASHSRSCRSSSGCSRESRFGSIASGTRAGAGSRFSTGDSRTFMRGGRTPPHCTRTSSSCGNITRTTTITTRSSSSSSSSSREGSTSGASSSTTTSNPSSLIRRPSGVCNSSSRDG